MNRIIAGAALILTTLVSLPSAALGQRRTTLGIAAGATVPTGDLGDGTSTGYHVLATVVVSGTATSPIGFRVDGMYNSLSGKSQGPDVTLWTVNGNVVLAFAGATGVTPYLIGGAGWYNMKADQSGADAANDFGLNAGLGARFVLSGFSTFGEVRFHNIFADPNSARVVPVTFGIAF